MQINMTFRQLEAFAALARTLNFSEAAKAINISQPALSSAISKLEELVNSPLFNRTTRSVSLTPVGEELLKISVQLLNDFDVSLARINDLIDGKWGKLSIAAVPSLAGTFLPEILNQFQQAYPGVSIYVRDALSEASIDSLKLGQVALALGPSKAMDDELSQRELFTDHLVLVCPSDHDLAKFKTVTWSKLQPYRLVSLTSTSNVRLIMEAEYLQHGTKFQPSFEVEHASTLIGFIVNKLGIGVLPASLVPLLNASNLTTVDLVNPEIIRSICCIRLKSRSLTPAALKFMEICEQYAKEYRTAGKLRH